MAKRNFTLTESDWVEIYYAVEGTDCDELIDKVGVDGKNQPEQLTDEEWLQIYLAVEDKLQHSPAVRGYDRPAREWRRQLHSILGELAEIHDEYIGPPEVKP